MKQFKLQIMGILLAVGPLAVTPFAVSQTGTVDGKTTTSSQQAVARQQQTVQLTPVNAELRNSVDSKHTKAGDQVTAVTQQPSTLNGTKLPKGTAITGHVTDVNEHSKTNPEGSVSMVFDQAKLKDGTTVPIHATIRSVAPSPVAQMMASQNQGQSGDELSAPATAPMPTAGANPQPPSAPLATGGVAGSTTNAARPATTIASGASDGVVNDAARSASVAGSGSTANGASSIPGVNLRASLDASASGTVSTPDHDVHLESGTQMLLGVWAQ